MSTLPSGALYLWQAVDQEGNVLDILVQSRRNTKAARRFMAKLVKKQHRVPRVLVTDKPRSYSVAHRKLTPSVEHRSHKGLNNRAENSHQPTLPGTRSPACPPRSEHGTTTSPQPP